MFDKVTKYEDNIIKFITKYEKLLYKVVGYFEKLILAIVYSLEFVSFLILDGLNRFNKIMRYTTIPFHWLWIKYELYMMSKKDLEDKPIFQIGVHYMYGLPKAGKSTLTYHAMMDYAYHTGKTSYTTAMMEIPRLNVYGREYYYHQLFDPSEFFSGGEQIVSFNTFRHNMIVYEEMLTRYHQRDNSKKSYNDEVLPMIAAMGTQRHQGIDLFYFISQLPRNDIALMQMLRGYHKMKIVKRFDYTTWLETGKFRFMIKGWRVVSYNVEATSGNDYKLVNKKRWFYKCIHQEDMNYFNRLNMKKHYQSLRMHRGVEMQ